MAHSDDDGPDTRLVPAIDLLHDDPTDPARRSVPGAPAPRAGGSPSRPTRIATPSVAQSPPPTPSPAEPTGRRDDGRVARMPLRHRVLPRSLLGLTALILSFAIGAGLSGVVLYSYYQYRLNQTDDRVNALVNGYKQQFANASGDLRAQTDQDRAAISAAVAPIQALEASPATLATLTRKLAPAMWWIHTLDGAGQASVGSAFVIASTPTQSLLLTSYTTVEAATRTPGPPVFLQQGQDSTQVTVRTWDPTYDLALVVLPRGGLPTVPVAPASPAPSIGERVYAVSGQASAGAALSQGLVTDVSASGVQHDAPLGPAFQGGPLVNGTGQVVAVSSRTYAPLGFATDSVWYSPYIQAACNKVLTCPGGQLPGT